MTDPRTIALENALKALGINPDNDPLHHAKRRISGRDDDRRERDQALTERDNATARVSARDMRIADLERTIEATHKVFDGVGVTWSTGLEAGRLPLPKRAEFAVSPGFLADAERKALEARTADLERDLATKDAALKTACDALTRIHAITGGDGRGCPDDAVEAVKTLLCESEGHHLRADRAEATLAEMVKALSDHGAPRYYDDPSTPTKRGAQLSPVERLRVILSIHHWKASAAERRAHEAEESREALLQERRLARDALLDMGAPCRADGFDLDLAARIRAIPR